MIPGGRIERLEAELARLIVQRERLAVLARDRYQAGYAAGYMRGRHSRTPLGARARQGRRPAFEGELQEMGL